MPLLRTFIALSLCVVAVQGQNVLRTLAGKSLSGSLVRMDDEKIVVKTASGEVNTPVQEVLQLDLEPAVTLSGLKYSDVELIDGSLLHCKQVALKGKDAELTVLPDRPLKLPLNKIRAILFTDAHDPKVRRDWQDFRGKQKGNRDLLVVVRDGVVNGLEGTFGDADTKGETIDFELASGKKFQPNLTRMHGMVFFRKLDGQAPTTLCTVTDTHRNTLAAASLRVDDGQCSIKTVAGLTVTYPSAKQLHRLDFNKLTYLSDLQPASTEFDKERADTIIRDKNLDNGTIRLTSKDRTQAMKAYPKGIILFAPTQLTFPLGGEFKDFKTILGSDAQYSGKEDTPVRVIFEADGKELQTVEIKPAAEPQPITLDLQGVKQLRVVVQSELGDRGHVVLADAKLSK